MLFLLKLYFGTGLLVIILIALFFLPGKDIVPKSKSEIRAFFIMLVVVAFFDLLG